ncbi:uncharacterized protein LOC115470832 [Microcaecilia unicolor]|uniref:Uncharacterized protein LOC115470832 n=1 Tax=Microcaecilia unicolor TaxID=1415580 RepID=A0A6P7Y5L2_9AMPH|nr:uncharacterized protein LOC115470832 [Microcaecilia unicolor]XP_030060267.1 uncharacterized protein LOC115470832 [Microcaecilia unicolor]XP_030060276.1 uncharacterized protein LOC115470832 [Microcaecilia unicolor]XP_030060286.1 uncharacterized protein LOC115470832 [Microcaecilia unicolor]
MNTAPASESGSYPTNHSRPFFYAQPTAQQPFPSPWYLSQVYNPYYLPPAPGFRSGNSYFPYYSVALPEFPGFFVPHPQLHARMSRRPYFIPHPSSPMFYQATRFRHYGSPGKRTETKETQTDPRQPESKLKKQSLNTDVKGCNTSSRTSCSSMCTENESNLETSLSPVIAGQERDFQNKNGCSSSTYRNIPPRSYSFEKEEVRIEYGNGPPAAIQLWKSYKETIPIYDVPNGKEMPENVIHVHSYEGGMYDSHAEGKELGIPSVGHSGDDGHRTPLPLTLSRDEVQEKEIKDSACPNGETRPGVDKQRNAMPVKTQESSIFRPAEIPTSGYDSLSAERQDIDQIQNSSRSKNFQTAFDSSDIVTSTKSNHEFLNSFGQQQNLANLCPTEICSDELKLDNKANLWFEESLEKYVPSPGWLACFDNMDANYNYDTYLMQRKQKRQIVLSSCSDELSSGDEESSLENTPVPYFLPDYMYKKNIYSFQKNTEGLEKENIKGSGSLNEEMVLREQASKSPTVQNSSVLTVKSRKLGLPLQGFSQKKLYSVKKKPRKSSPLLEPTDSDKVWVLGEENICDYEDESEDGEETDEAECVFQDIVPIEQLSIGTRGFFKQVPQKKLLGRPVKIMSPAQLLNWPSHEQLKSKKKAHGNSGSVRKPKEREQLVVFSDYRGRGKRPTTKLERVFKEVPELKKTLHKSLGGKPQKGSSEKTIEESWVGKGAKPKVSEQLYGLQPPTKTKELDKPSKKKGLLKSYLKSKITRNDPEDVEFWEVPKSSGHRGRGMKRGAYRKQ